MAFDCSDWCPVPSVVLAQPESDLSVEHRRTLMDDFPHVALDYGAKPAKLQFQSNVAKLQAAMDCHPRELWRLYPCDLEGNINT